MLTKTQKHIRTQCDVPGPGTVLVSSRRARLFSPSLGATCSCVRVDFHHVLKKFHLSAIIEPSTTGWHLSASTSPISAGVLSRPSSSTSTPSHASSQARSSVKGSIDESPTHNHVDMYLSKRPGTSAWPFNASAPRLGSHRDREPRTLV